MHERLLTLANHSLSLFSIGGGGGSSGGGSGGSSGGYSGGGSADSTSFSPLLSSIIFGIILVFVIWGWLKGKQQLAKLRTKSAQEDAELTAAAQADSIWNTDNLTLHATDIFLRYQKDWSTFNLESMKSYMTERYYMHNQLMMGALKSADRQNLVQDAKVLSADIELFHDDADNSKDGFTASLNVQAHDITLDTRTNTELFVQDVIVNEGYRFVRFGNTWLFDGIDEATADPEKRQIPLEEFATNNHFFYSLDWGWLLLPSVGQVFGKGRFGTSDINNHVIGMYNDIIVQIYTYSENPIQNGIVYLIAQTSLPKSYGDIVVRHKSGLFHFGIKGLTQIKTEWQQFNDKYEVFASDTERATSFELLHPKFMEQIEALPFEVSIEVVDNALYLYSPNIQSTQAEQYQTMLDVLKSAFKEMKM